jgi:hypothetical protein
MSIQGGFMIYVISAVIISTIVVMLGLWYHREKKRAGARLRELRDAISEMNKD